MKWDIKVQRKLNSFTHFGHLCSLSWWKGSSQRTIIYRIQIFFSVYHLSVNYLCFTTSPLSYRHRPARAMPRAGERAAACLCGWLLTTTKVESPGGLPARFMVVPCQLPRLGARPVICTDS